MKHLKTLFIPLYISLAFTGLLLAGWKIADTSSSLFAAMALAAIAALPIGFFLSLYLTPRARTDSQLKPLQTASVLLTIPVAIYPDWTIAFAAAAINISGYLYIYWYSQLMRPRPDVISVGETLPWFELTDADGNKVTSLQLANKPSLMIFYRGNWCPLCMAQIKEVAKAYQQLESMGIRVAMISSQPANHTKVLSEKFKVDFDWLIDNNNQAAQTLGLVDEGGTPAVFLLQGHRADTAMPTVVMTDATGKVIFADLTDNYRVRPEPETFIAIFQQHLDAGKAA
ncbi:peroxiredoxin family protein [Pelagibaculum spongiae]|uniref:Thioredoxin domain-containing protein n=1 Tax=Pelagibaculum spongiae TaxID=2080658 RepID=A0A2V1H213_9GAMM|nr:redoxin domain-containing protein [Pelagibaculum spongiae]PVZ70482.1 hypothetical protein DC094_07825 [Pelagibaculum spongiae]